MMCYCGKPMNPKFVVDSIVKQTHSELTFKQLLTTNLVECEQCKYVHHIQCVRDDPYQRCFSCSFSLTQTLNKAIMDRKRDKKGEVKAQEK